MPSLNPDGTLNTTKKTVYIVDSILYSAGYFLLQNTTLGLLDSLLLRLQHHGSTFALPERAMRWFHIAITAGAVLSIWGGLKLANDPLTHEDMDTSRTYRLIGVAVIAVATICMGGASIQASTANLPYDTAHRSGGRFLAIVCICLLVRVGTSYWFIQNPQRMFDEKVLYGLAIAMEMPAAVLLSITPCLALFMNRAGPPMSETVGMQPYEPYHPVVNQAEGGKAQSCA
ncbi:uncharacterized protein EV422DRAFT_544452 [Fimicolochytrium jonesii]|uniref:uncharacterized protein n=1 Tax=Fimicolochytrium jonesii TaxID=1396493 RepID=UPI0022FF2EEA|nr:uncharacterized protein EV422DRAFT_544452 [Fimicolochytrium jonesii]KAI8816669.1 hypothetical protein EV422DRAFT_544452 [Fimicolochytrium jonesii]